MSNKGSVSSGINGIVLVVGCLFFIIPILVIMGMFLFSGNNKLMKFDISEKYLSETATYINKKYHDKEKEFKEYKSIYFDLLSKEFALMKKKESQEFKYEIIEHADDLKKEEADIVEGKAKKYTKLIECVINGVIGKYEKSNQKVRLIGDVVDFYDEKETKWGVRGYYPIARGFKYNHYDDYGDGREYNNTKSKHDGNDIVCDKGTPIVNIEDGYIEQIGWNEMGGWRVGIRSMDGKRYLYYAHMQSYTDKFTSVGQKVSAGEVIGYVGNSGYGAEGTEGKFISHLHFQMQVTYEDKGKKKDVWIDPYHFLKLVEVNKVKVEEHGKEYKSDIKISAVDD